MASVIPLVIRKNNDMSLELGGVADARTLSALNSGVVTVTLTSLDGTEVSGQTWPTLLSYVSGSSGVYRTILVDSLAVTAGDRLLAGLVYSGGANERAEWELDVVVRKRKD